MKKIAPLWVFLLVYNLIQAQTPFISSFTPLSAKPGDAVTITGTGFNTTPANNVVFFGATRAVVSTATVNSLTVTVPSGSKYGPITVLNTSNNLAAYSAAGFNPVYAPPKTTITTADYNQEIFSSNSFGSGPGTISDIDGDGKPDLVVAQNGGGTSHVVVLRNTSIPGTISFAPLVDFSTGSNQISLAAGDLDGDGKPDLAVTATGVSNIVSVFRNTSSIGNISFAPNVDFATPGGPSAVAIGDLDGDGKPDLATANSAITGPNSVSVFRNTGSVGTVNFVRTDLPTLLNSLTRSIAIGDLDGDGKPDIVTADNAINSVLVYRNTSNIGNISFAPRTGIGNTARPVSIVIADLNGDGKPEVTVGGDTNLADRFTIFNNSSSIGFIDFNTHAEVLTALSPNTVSVGDINGDGKPDLVVTDLANLASSGRVGIYLNSSSGFGTIAPTIFLTSARPAAIGICDLDGDAKPEMAMGMTNGPPIISIFHHRVCINPTPVIIAGGPTTFCPGGSVSLSTNTGTGFSYQWKLDGNNIPGATSSTYLATTAGNYTVTVTYSAACFATSVGTNVSLNSSPTINCPTNITLNSAVGQCGANVTYPAATTTGTPTPVITYSHASGSYFPVGTTIVTATATNECGTVTCNFNVIVTDNEPPTISCPSNINISATSASGAIVNYAAPIGIDNCGGAITVMTAGLASGSTFPIGNTTVTYQVTDAAGLSAQCSCTVTVTGLAPQILCPANISVSSTIGQCGAIVNFAASESTAIPASTITYSHQPGSFFPVGTTTVTATATNAVGTSECTFTITVMDDQPPTISCPSSISATATSGSGAVVNYTAPTGIDNCGGATTLLISGLPSGSTFPIGNTTVTYQVTDAAGLSAQCSFTVTVTGSAPQILCPSNITVNSTTGQCGAIVNFAATESTAIPASTITYSHQPGTFFPVGTTSVTATASNVVGISDCTFTITVLDDQPPTISCPSSISATATSASGAVVNYAAPIGIDNCGGDTTVMTAGLASGSTFPIGATTVTYKVTDAAGLSAQCSFTVTVTGLAPQILCPANISVSSTIGQCGAIVNFAASESTAIPASTITYSHQPGSFFPVGTTTVTATATNVVGISVCTFTITVLDNQPPTISCPANIHINATGTSGAVVNYTAPVGVDNCAGASTLLISGLPSGSTFPIGTTTQTYRVTDGAGNTATCTQRITVCQMSVSLGINSYVLYGALGYAGCGTLSPVITGGLAPFTYSWTSTDPAVNGSTASSIITCNTTNIVRNYTVVVTDVNGCSGMATVSLTFININCSNNGNNVKVLVCHRPPGNPGNCQTICVSVNSYQTLLDNGSYLGTCLPLCAIPTTGRSGNSSISQYIVNDELFNVKVMNNPTETFFRLSVSGGSFYDKINIRVMDIRGRLLEQKTIMYSDNEIKLGEKLLPGVYLAEITKGVNRKTIKLIKQ